MTEVLKFTDGSRASRDWARVSPATPAAVATALYVWLVFAGHGEGVLQGEAQWPTRELACLGGLRRFGCCLRLWCWRVGLLAGADLRGQHRRWRLTVRSIQGEFCDANCFLNTAISCFANGRFQEPRARRNSMLVSLGSGYRGGDKRRINRDFSRQNRVEPYCCVPPAADGGRYKGSGAS